MYWAMKVLLDARVSLPGGEGKNGVAQLLMTLKLSKPNGK